MYSKNWQKMDAFRNSEKCAKTAHFLCIAKTGRKWTHLEIQKRGQKLHISYTQQKLAENGHIQKFKKWAKTGRKGTHLEIGKGNESSSSK